MEVYRTEEEQIEAIKRWWKDNGSSILIGIGVAIALVFGWQSWQQNSSAKGEAASVLFSQMQDASRALQSAPPVPAKEGDAAENPQRVTFEHLAKQLKEEYAGTTYSVLAAMLVARDKVEAGNPAEAEKELRWALDQKPSQAVSLIINLRLARVLAMKGETDNAIKLLESIDTGAQKPAYEELRGDLYMVKGDLIKAREAYKAGLDAATEASNNRSLLKTKFDDLAVAE